MKIEKLTQLVPEIGETSVIDENYPHIVEKLIFLWDSPECMQYLDELLGYTYTSERPERRGFSLAALNELHLTQQTHHRLFPYVKSDYSQRRSDPWSIKTMV